jgi:hypothetical protein
VEEITKCIISDNVTGAGFSCSAWKTGMFLELYNSSGSTVAQKTNSVAIGVPQLITFTFTRGLGETNSIINIWVDGLTVYNLDTARYPAIANNGMAIAASVVGSSRNNGLLHYLAYYNGTVLTATDHANMYAALKQAGILPLIVGSAQHYNRLRVRFSYCGMAASQTGPLLELSGSLGTAASNANRIKIAMSTTTLRASIYAAKTSDDSGGTTERFASKSVSHNSWHDVDLTVRFDDLSLTSLTVDGAAGTNDATLADARYIKTLNTKLRVGQDYNIGTFANAKIRDLAVYVGND